MAADALASLEGRSDAELVSRLRALLASERSATAEVVAHLAEIAARDLFLHEGYSSLFVYCRDGLGLSEADAYVRIEAARAARRFPVVLEMLADGAINLTTIRLLAPHLTSDNHRRVLESARGKKRAAVEEMVAALAPLPDVPSFVRKLPSFEPTLPPGAVPLRPVLPASSADWRPASSPLPDSVAPLAPDRYRLQVTIDGEVLEKLRLAKDMLRHALPSGDDALVLDRALTALLADLARKKFAATEAPRPSASPGAGSRHVPAEVKRAVWLRDLGRCAFVAESGRRCHERGFVEFHHVKPYAAGGPATADNIELRCRRHNAYEARLYFGEGAKG
jgi:hypothetical protein